MSTLEDLAVWVKAIADGSLLWPETLAKRLNWTKIPGEKFPVSYGLGIMDFAGFKGHNGALLGYSTFMVTNPEVDTTIICAANSSTLDSGDANLLFINLLEMLYPELIPKS